MDNKPLDKPSNQAGPSGNDSGFRWPVLMWLAVAILVTGGIWFANLRFAKPKVQERIPAARFTNVTAEAGITFVHNNGAYGDKLLPETMGAGVAFLDYDNDGDQDLLFINSCPWPEHESKEGQPPTQKLCRNDGNGHFQDVTREAGLDQSFYGQGVAVGDYDNDGDVDIYITAIGRGYLFRNDGKGHFEDVSDTAHAKGPNGWLTGAAFIDIDNDGDLDLFICNYITWTPGID